MAERARYRVGSHYGIHVYDGNRPVATFHAADEAVAFVAAANAATRSAVPDPTVEARPDPLWVRMVTDVADQLWQAGNKQASGDLHEALRRARAAAPDALRVRIEALAAEVVGAHVRERSQYGPGYCSCSPRTGDWVEWTPSHVAAILAPLLLLEDCSQ